jgi:hypothetical protein
MAGFIIDTSARTNCAHNLAPATAVSPDSRVTIAGAPIMTVQRQYLTPLCTETNSKCTSAEWTLAAQRVTASGLAVAISTGLSSCAPSKLPMVVLSFQQRVTAS